MRLLDFVAALMTAVSTSERAALESFFQGRRGNRVLIRSSSSMLTAYFADKGTTLRELPTARPPDAKELGAWAEEWTDAAEVAGIDDKLDVRNVGRWIVEEDLSVRTGGLRSGKAFAVADALTKRGFTVDRSAELAISAALATADAGDARAQCRSVEVIWLLYLGQLPGEEERTLFQEKRAASAREDVDPTIDIRLFKAYYKQLTATSVPTLERCLKDKSGQMWRTYYGEKITQFNENGFNHATSMFIQVVGYAREIAAGHFEFERRYLLYYFYRAHLGRGMPEPRNDAAAHMARSNASLDDVLGPKSPAELLADERAAMGQWSHSGFGYGGYGPPAGLQGSFNMGQAQQPTHFGQMLAPPAVDVAMPQMAANVNLAQLMQQMQMMAGGGRPMHQQQQQQLQVEEIEIEPCQFCGGKHALASCTQFKQARSQHHQSAADKSAAKKAAADVRKAAAAAAAAAAGAVPPAATP